MTTQPAPVLQLPGAGLPWWELLITRYILLPLGCRSLSWADADRLFQKEGAKIVARWDGLSPEQLAERVLIQRVQGIEDSSRNWSVAMTVEHLNIVGRGIGGVVAGLQQGKLPVRNARIQDVKPTGKIAAAAVREGFAQLLDDSAASPTPPVPRGEGLRAPHPWFGPMDAHTWHCLRAFHHRIHRVQIEAIIAGLRPAGGGAR